MRKKMFGRIQREVRKFGIFLQVSVGTLLSFTVVALSILILRYVPPDELPFLPSDQQSNV